MGTHVVLLRAVNLGARNKVPMPRLRELLTDAGFNDVKTMLASGNVVLRSPDSGSKVAQRVHSLIADEWGLDIDVIVRTPRQLRKILDADPIASAHDDPKRYTVTFLAEPAGKAYAGLDPTAFGDETFAVLGSELYSWMPGGIHNSALAKALGRVKRVGTARNWDTVTKLADLADSLST